MGATIIGRLGFSPEERVAVVHADDIGMSHAANVGSFEALDRGPVTCGSVMVPCPWFAEAAALARARPDVDLGVHLTLNCEYTDYRWGPVLGPKVPSLRAPDGGMLRRLVEVQDSDADEVEQELRAQIDRALDAGIDVTHLDPHMGTALLPHILPVYGRLASDYRLPVMMNRPNVALAEQMGARDAIQPMVDVCERFDAEGIPIFDLIEPFSLDFEEGNGVAWNRQRIDNLVPGLNWLLCHPAQAGEELSAIVPETAHQRDFERTFYGGEPGRKMLEEAGVRTIGMRALRDLMRGSD